MLFRNAIGVAAQDITINFTFKQNRNIAFKGNTYFKPGPLQYFLPNNFIFFQITLDSKGTIHQHSEVSALDLSKFFYLLPSFQISS